MPDTPLIEAKGREPTNSMACYGPQPSRSSGSDSAGMAASGPRNSTEAGGGRLEVLMPTLLMGALLVGLTPAAPNLFLAGMTEATLTPERPGHEFVTLARYPDRHPSAAAPPGTPDRHPSAAAAPGTPELSTAQTKRVQEAAQVLKDIH